MTALRKITRQLCLVAALGFAATSANATVVSYYLDQSNDELDGINYATVTIKDGADASNVEYVDFMVEVNLAAFDAIGTGRGPNFGMQDFYFNYNLALDLDVANIINIDPASWDINANKNAGGGFGKFEFQLKGDGSDRTVYLSFSIAGVDGDTVADYAMSGDTDPELNSAEFFATHIADYNGGDSAKFGGSTLVPVPAAVWLMGSALAGLGFMRRKKIV